jgi:hypothetical protein
MNFLYPSFLFALFAVAIPIIIHLFSFRRYKTVYFSHVGFLKDIKKESQKKARLKHLLMLLARILTIIFLVLAFAQPYIPTQNNVAAGSNQVVGVYIDNSFSMNALSEKGQLLELARNKAAEIGQAYPTGTRFMIFTNDLEPRHQNLLNKEQFISQVIDLKQSPAVIPLSFINNRFEQLVSRNEPDAPGTLYFISDFQRSITDLNNFGTNSHTAYLIPLTPNQTNNLYIDSCWVEVPAHSLIQEENLFVKIRNTSNQDFQNLPLQLYLNDSLKSITSFSVGANNEMTATLRYKNGSAGIQLGKVEITDYPFTHDNSWYLSYFVEPKLKALAIHNNSATSIEGMKYLSALFQNDDYVELEAVNVQNLQISKLTENNTIFLIQPDNFSTGFLNEIASAVGNGTSVVLFPNISQTREINNQFLSRFGAGVISGLDTTTQEISGIDFDSRFFANVFQEKKENAMHPRITSHLKFSENVRSEEASLLWFQNGDKALSVLPFGNGKVWVFSFPLNKANEAFTRDILFVPSIYNIVLNSLPDQQLSHTIGKEQSFFLPRMINTNRESSIEIENRESGSSFIPAVTALERGTRLSFEGTVTQAGHYLVKQENETLTSLSFNYNRQESDLRYFTAEELKNRLSSSSLDNVSVIETISGSFTDILQELQKGRQLWKWCILIALFFISAEAAIARFWRQ